MQLGTLNDARITDEKMLAYLHRNGPSPLRHIALAFRLPLDVARASLERVTARGDAVQLAVGHFAAATETDRRREAERRLALPPRKRPSPRRRLALADAPTNGEHESTRPQRAAS